MSWANLLGNLAGDLISGRNVNHSLQRARYDLGRAAASSIASSIKARQAAAAKAQEESNFVLIRAMIAAASADGEVDASERKGIVDKAREAGLDAAGMKRIEQELAAPATPEQIAKDLQGADPVMVYQLSLMAITLDDGGEYAHLRRLAKALGLGAEKVATLHAELGAPPPK